LGSDTANTTNRFRKLEQIYGELIPIVLSLSRQGEQMQEIAVGHDLTTVISDLEQICKAVRDLKLLAGALADPNVAQRLVAETDVLKAQRTLRHDLRTQINAIKGYGEILLEDLEDLDAEVIRPHLLILLNEAVALSARIYDIVDFGGDGNKMDGDERAPASEYLSVSTRPISEAHKGPFSGRPSQEPGQVLVVDDMAANRDILYERLTRQGHFVTVSDNGVEALELLRAGSFELVLLDVIMPEMDGFEVLARIKNDEALRDIPVIMVSALDEMESVIRCIELGAEDYLPKSFDPILLRARVNACLERKKWGDRERAHVKRLASAIQQVQEGDLTVTLDYSREDVYGEVYRGFNQMTAELRTEAQILAMSHDLSGELALDTLLEKFIHTTTILLDAEHGILFLYDRKMDELWARLSGDNHTPENRAGDIRIKADAGLAGAVFQTGKVVNLENAKDHPSFAGLIDEMAGIESRSVLAMPIVTKAGETIGVTQLLNKRSGAVFTAKDEARLSAFCAQIAFTLYNAQLFDETTPNCLTKWCRSRITTRTFSKVPVAA
jgi:CheY-like chemotaxis protein